MQTPVIDPQASQLSWTALFRQPIQPFAATRLEVLSGAIPAGLRGSLYRVGAALFERQGERISHWFDGDGAVLVVHFQESHATASYRFVETTGYLAEEKAGKFLWGGYGRVGNWGHRTIKNTANTSVLALEDRLWALWEGGHPYQLDLDTLQTLREEPLVGVPPQHTFSAHPKCDPTTGAIYNFGLSFGRKTKLHLYRCDRHGHVQQQSEFALARISLIHDFALAGSYLIFCISPVNLKVLPLLLKWQSYGDAFRWQPQCGTQLLIFDRDTLELVSRGEADPWFQWHFGNGYATPDGEVVLDIVRYQDFQSNSFLKEVPSGNPKVPVMGQLWRLRLHPLKAKILSAECLSPEICEFPTIHPHLVGQQHLTTFLVTQSNPSNTHKLFDALAYVNHGTETFERVELGGDRYPSEPIVAPDAEDSKQSWVLSVIYDGQRQASEVWIFNGRHIAAGPVCRLGLPSPIALDFHGTWKAA